MPTKRTNGISVNIGSINNYKQMVFFKYIYYNMFHTISKVNLDKEFSIILPISFCQTNNLLTIINIFGLCFFNETNYHLPNAYLIIQIVLFAFNYYYFIIRKNGKVILQDDKFSFGNKKYLADLYIYVSVIVMLLTYYFYREY